jgi:hypothetical protein
MQFTHDGLTLARIAATVLGVVRGDVDAPVQMDKCPAGAAVIRSNTTDVRCLPHQIGTCVAAAIRAGLIVVSVLLRVYSTRPTHPLLPLMICTSHSRREMC